MRTFFKLMLVLLILGAGWIIAKKLIETKPTAMRKPVSIGAPLVETVTAEPVNEQIRISAMGTVVPAREVIIQPRVSGHIVEISPDLVPGGRFKTGDVLLRIDDRDYKIMVNQKKAQITQATMELKTEKRRQAIAKQEWNLLSSEIATTKEGRDLALRKPHIENAKAALESARSSLERALLDVERTVIRASFNAFVKEKFADTGQHVTPGSKLATLVGTDEFWVQISVPVNRLPWISIPGFSTAEGSHAYVTHGDNSPGTRIVRQGRVVRLLGDLDPVGRMARLLVAVKDPFGIRNSEFGIQNPDVPGSADKNFASGAPDSDSMIPGSALCTPLLLGAYVNVDIQGPQLNDVFIVPRKALREGNRVWIAGTDRKLAVKKADVVWRRKDDVLAHGFDPGDQIITSRISAPVEGMELRVAGSELEDME